MICCTLLLYYNTCIDPLENCFRRGALGFTVLALFASVFRSFRFRSLVLRFSTALWFAVVNPYHRRFMVCRCSSQFFGGFITCTLRAALQRYTDIMVSVFNNFGHGFVVFGAFCYSFCYPPMPPSFSYGSYMCIK